jgi:glutamate carboxypeptidase
MTNAEVAARVRAEMEALCAVSSPWSDHPGAERCIELVLDFLPAGGEVQRITSSSEPCVDDLVVTYPGTGSPRLMLLGHLDTVVAHAAHRPVTVEGDRLVGSGTSDMKGGVAISLAVARDLVATPEAYAELSVLLVCDEEWRTQPFIHGPRFSHYDACLCFEAGARTAAGEPGVLVRRKGACTMKVHATGRAAHSGSQPQAGANALLALARVAEDLATLEGPDSLTVVPTIIQAGEALNMVPPSGELTFDLRCNNDARFHEIAASIPAEINGVKIEPEIVRIWPAMDSTAVTVDLLASASRLYGTTIIGTGRGGASDASHFAPHIALCVDGLGPLGGGAHNPEEWVNPNSLGPRTELALAVAHAALASLDCSA